MKNTYLLKAALAICFLLSTGKLYSQARSSVGIGYGINRPYSSDYKSSTSLTVQGSIAITDKIAIIPTLSYDRLLADREKSLFPYQAFRVSNIDLMSAGASAQYHFYKGFFVKAGPIFYAAGANEDVANISIGGSGAVGYNLNLDNHNTIELSVGTSIIDIPPVSGNGTTSIASFKIAYAFNFRRLK